jgi:hypothetical protein
MGNDRIESAHGGEANRFARASRFDYLETGKPAG